MRLLIRLTIAAFILAAFYLLLPAGLGFAVKGALKKAIQRDSSITQQRWGIKLAITHYHRGWFQSHANLVVTQKNHRMMMPITIDHGPIIRRGHDIRIALGFLDSKPKLLLNTPYAWSLHASIGLHSIDSALVLQSKAALQLDHKMTPMLVLDLNSSLHGTIRTWEIIGHHIQYAGHHDSSLSRLHIKQFTLSGQMSHPPAANMMVSLHLNQGRAVFFSGSAQADAQTILSVKQLAIQHIHINMRQLLTIHQHLIMSAHWRHNPALWLHALERLVSSVVTEQTELTVADWTTISPMGRVVVNDRMHFSGLPANHDYFDVLYHQAGSGSVYVPSWHYLDPSGYVGFNLQDALYVVQHSGALMGRSSLTIGRMSLLETQPQTVGHPLLSVKNLQIRSHIGGGLSLLSEQQEWSAKRLCILGGCAKKPSMKIMASDLKVSALKGIMRATHHLIHVASSAHPMIVPAWIDVLNAYVNLLTNQTKLLLQVRMQLPKGPFLFHATGSWPGLPVNIHGITTSQNAAREAIYAAKLVLPSVYVTAYLAANPAPMHDAPASEVMQRSSSAMVKSQQDPELIFANWLRRMIAAGYLESMNQSFKMNLLGHGKTVTINGQPWRSASVQNEIKQ